MSLLTFALFCGHSASKSSKNETNSDEMRQHKQIIKVALLRELADAEKEGAKVFLGKPASGAPAGANAETCARLDAYCRQIMAECRRQVETHFDTYQPPADKVELAIHYLTMEHQQMVMQEIHKRKIQGALECADVYARWFEKLYKIAAIMAHSSADNVDAAALVNAVNEGEVRPELTEEEVTQLGQQMANILMSQIIKFHFIA